jgi:hypothetical protein
MKSTLLFSFGFALLFSCGKRYNEEDEIKSLLLNWSTVDSKIIGGPSELKGIEKVDSITIYEQNHPLLGKIKNATLSFTTTTGKAKKVNYTLDKYNDDWEITSIDGHGVYPYINLKIMEGRRKLNFK